MSDKLIENSLEYDLNPFMIFDKDAKVVKFNQEAEYLLSFVSPKEIFELAMSCAPVNFGYKNSYISLEYNRVKYYAIQVGYEDEEYILVKLYKEVNSTDFAPKDDNSSKVSLFTLLELAINNTIDTNKVEIEKRYDPSIPEIYMRVKEFMLLLNASLKEFRNSKNICIKVAVKIAENIVINKKRYPVAYISFYDKEATIRSKSELKRLAKEANTLLYIDEGKITLEFAIVE